MAAGRILGPWIYNADGDGAPLALATLTTYVNGTTTPRATFTTAALDVAHDNPIVADNDGRFPDIFADTQYTFSIKWEEADGTDIDTYDNIIPLGPEDASSFAAVDLSNVTPADGLAAGVDWGLTGQGFRNRVINGACRINQRNGDAAVVLGTSRTYGFDRWSGKRGASQAATLQRSTGGPTGTPFSYVALYACTTGAAAGASDQAYLETIIEGSRLVDAMLGTSSAKYLAIRFRIQPSAAGKHSFYIQNADRSRSYVFTQTLVQAWQEVTAVIAGDQTGTWETDTDAGLIFGVDMGSGSNFEGAADAWAGADRRRTSDSASNNATTGRQCSVTGVQIAVVSDSTTNPPFEEVDYATDLALCRRYFYRLTAPGVNNAISPFAMQAGTTRIFCPVHFGQPMRGAPTLVTSTPAWSNAAPDADNEIAFYDRFATAYVSITGALTLSTVLPTASSAELLATAASSFSGTTYDGGYFVTGAACIIGFDADYT